jgi:hypothetical protein
LEGTALLNFGYTHISDEENTKRNIKLAGIPGYIPVEGRFGPDDISDVWMKIIGC